MIAIVGRPNVGKSSLLNVLVGERVSIVEPTPGVTRDRVSAVCQLGDVFVELVDTGGYGIDDVDQLTEEVTRQVRYAIERANLILFVVDARAEIVPLDQTVAELLRKHHDRVMLVANKADTPGVESQAGVFGRLGFGPATCVSAAHGLGKAELKQKLADTVRELAGQAEAPDPVMKMAIVGRRNAGKSTFVNALAGEERVIVSEVAGTTRDAVDVRFERDGRTFVAIDTAGVRKKSKIADSIEFYSFQRAQRSIQRADVVLLMLDATEPAVSVDKKLASVLIESFKPVVIVVNKWDLAKGRTSTETYGDYLSKVLEGLDYAPVAFVSAISGKNVSAAVDVAAALFNQSRTRMSTGSLNRALGEVLAERGPSQRRGAKRPRIYYAAQVATAPPTIVLFVNHADALTANYLRFLTNRFRDCTPFSEVPIRLVVRSHHDDRRGSNPAGRVSAGGN